MKKFKYYSLSFLTFLISFAGVLGIKLSIFSVAIAVGFLTESYFGKYRLIVGFIIGLFFAGILMLGIQCLFPYWNKFNKIAKSYKQFPFSEKYGIDYEKPTPAQFGITTSEFVDYNKRFQFEFIKIILTYGIVILATIFVFSKKIEGKYGILIMGLAILSAIFINKLFNYFNDKISRKHCAYEKIKKFQQAISIYHKILNENKKY